MWGRPIVWEGGVGPDFISPIWTQQRRNDPVTKELLDIGARISKPTRRLGNGYELTPDEYSRYQELAGRYIYEDIAAAMAEPGWEQMEAEERVERVDDIAKGARKAAREELMLGVPPMPPGYAVAR